MHSIQGKGLIASFICGFMLTASAGVIARDTSAHVPTADELAVEFRKAVGDGHQPVKFTTWLSNIWADQVLVTHEPALAKDGPIDGRKLGAGEIAIFKNMVAAIPDYRQENVSVKVDGNVIEFYEEIVGTMPDGSVPRAPIRYQFTINNGRIVHANGIFDVTLLAPFMAVTAKAGLRTPN